MEVDGAFPVYEQARQCYLAGLEQGCGALGRAKNFLAEHKDAVFEAIMKPRLYAVVAPRKLWIHFEGHPLQICQHVDRNELSPALASLIAHRFGFHCFAGASCTMFISWKTQFPMIVDL